MIVPNLHSRVKVAYKKLKQMVYYEKHPLTLRKRLAVFECADDFEERLQNVTNVVRADIPHQTSEFKSWLDDISFEIVPKGVSSPDKGKGELGSFVSNVTSAPEYEVSKVNYIFDGPVELHLLSVLWLMFEGAVLDRKLSVNCSGSRLHEYVGNDSDRSACLFKKYHELYATWRDAGIQNARELLSKKHQSVCVVGLDVREYYYRIELDWDELNIQLEPRRMRDWGLRSVRYGKNLFRCIKEVCNRYRDEIEPMLAITHPDLPANATCLPIGLCASPVIANWYLKEFDDSILEKVRPSYYGRYVDDILMVVQMPNPPKESDPITSFMEQFLVTTEILKSDKKQSRFELTSRPGLFLQKDKCILQYFDAAHSTAGLEKFQKQIEENASDFALLPVDGDDSPVAQVAYDLLYDGSVNKFRSVKAIAENRWGLAGHLAKQTQLYLMTNEAVDQHLKGELFRFFKGRNAIDYWDMWERVFSFFVVAGDRKGVESFKKAMLSEIRKVNCQEKNDGDASDTGLISDALKHTLTNHLNRCVELSMAVAKSTRAKKSSFATQLWRDSNLIRHHLVAVPLLNYTNYDGNLVVPKNAIKLDIDAKKAAYNPRFVPFEECLGFVEAGCAGSDTEDSIALANAIYRQFHGADFGGVTSEEIVEKESK